MVALRGRRRVGKSTLVQRSVATAGGPVTLVGSIKWRETQDFCPADTRALVAVKDAIPGVDPSTALLGVSRRGFRGDPGLKPAATLLTSHLRRAPSPLAR